MIHSSLQFLKIVHFVLQANGTDTHFDIADVGIGADCRFVPYGVKAVHSFRNTIVGHGAVQILCLYFPAMGKIEIISLLIPAGKNSIHSVLIIGAKGSDNMRSLLDGIAQ